MRRPTVDYSGFRLSRLGEPRFSHIRLFLVGWAIYFSLYFLTENLIPAERCHPIHIWLDDVIPFNEFFVIFYVGWYVLVVGSLLYYFLYDTGNFRSLQTFIMITQLVAMAVYILYPSRQDLRPEQFARDNLLTRLIGLIYSFDTNTGVFPSLHVAYSIGILSVFWKDNHVSKLWKALLAVIVCCICLSVCFVKQHSAADIFGALPVCALAEYIVFGKTYWRGRSKART